METGKRVCVQCSQSHARPARHFIKGSSPPSRGLRVSHPRSRPPPSALSVCLRTSLTHLHAPPAALLRVGLHVMLGLGSR